MLFQGHLLYIDITQICGIGCAFCIYADKHKAGISIELSTLARDNLSRLINTPEVERISISGEGEPLNNAKVFHEISGCPKVVSASNSSSVGYKHDKLEEFTAQQANLLGQWQHLQHPPKCRQPSYRKG